MYGKMMIVMTNDDYDDYPPEVYEKIKEHWEVIAGMSDDFYKQATKWWNTRCSPTLRILIVASAYYESLAQQAHHIDEFVQDILEEDSE
jgi:hypothetical protein